MAKKNVYFYAVSLFNIGNNQEINYSDIKNIYGEIFDQHMINNALLLEDGEHQVTMDIIHNDSSYLFGKIGKIQENNSLQFRNFQTLENAEVLNPLEKHNKGVEIFTYFLLDYQHGILSIIAGQAAPRAKILNNIIGKYIDEYYTEIVSISNPNSVKALFTEGATLSQLTYSCAIPDSKVLGDIIGLDRKQVATLRGTNSHEVEITVRNRPRKLLTNSVDIIKNIVESFNQKKENYNKVIFRGKTNNGSTQDYPLTEKLFTYSVDIPTYKIEDYKPVYFNRKELDDFFYVNMKMAYNESVEELLVLSNRYRK